MAFARPTLATLVDRTQQDLISRLALSGPVLRRSLVYVLARVVAGAVHMLHGFLEYLSKQIFPDFSDAEHLKRQASLYGLALTAATFAEGDVTLTGTNGSVVVVGTKLVRVDGAEYETTTQGTIASGTAVVGVSALVAGADGSAEAGAVLTFQSPVAGVNATATVAAGGLVGADEETIDSLRKRLKERMSAPPHGGNDTDYIAWAKEVPGVTRVWVYPRELGPGTVSVRFVRDDDATIIPSAGEVAEVQAHLEAKRPVTADVTALAPIGVPLNFTIDITPDNSTTRAAVTAELQDVLLRDAEPGGTILRSQLLIAIGNAEGLTDFTLTAPTADVTHSTGQMATFGTITWT